MKHLFSERYKDLIHTGNGKPVDEITGDVPYDLKRRIADVMFEFRETCLVRLNRYDDMMVEDDALNLAVESLNDRLGYELINLDPLMHGTCFGEAAPLQNLFTPHLFDLIELQYGELSDNREDGKEDFRKEINRVFRENDCPWLLVDGHMVKIDARQFEQDLKLKALELMKDLADANSVYQGAYEELCKAVEFLGRDDYPEAVTNAAKSYESVMKLVCGLDNANAGKLTEKIVNGGHLDLPSGIAPTAFNDKVLMSLPFLRNHAAAHGAGTGSTQLSKPLANLAVNLACALDTYLVQETANKE